VTYLEQQWLHFLKQIGFEAEIQTIRAGFYPRGGGEISVKIQPVKQLYPLRITERGKFHQVKGLSTVSNLDINIAMRQKIQSQKMLSGYGVSHEITVEEMPAIGKGTMLFLKGKFEFSQCCYFGLGAIGKRAETVADEACQNLITFLQTRGVVDEHLADQLIIPLSLTKGLSRFITPRITEHLLTNIGIVKLFLPVTINVSGNINEEGTITIERLLQ
jgi:RNA 3'-terminal phosphate cyclase (ATP)